MVQLQCLFCSCSIEGLLGWQSGSWTIFLVKVGGVVIASDIGEVLEKCYWRDWKH